MKTKRHLVKKKATVFKHQAGSPVDAPAAIRGLAAAVDFFSALFKNPSQTQLRLQDNET